MCILSQNYALHGLHLSPKAWNKSLCYTHVLEILHNINSGQLLIMHLKMRSYNFNILGVFFAASNGLTRWGRVTHICIGYRTIIGSDNGLSPGGRQAIIWTNAGISSIGLQGTHCNKISIKIHTFSFKKIHLKRSSVKWQPFCLSLNVLTHWGRDKMDAITQMTFSLAFSSMKMVVFWSNFHWNMFARVQLTIIQHWFR